jgi:4-hydroxythreonine-4-phosphate dehydrogenase
MSAAAPVALSCGESAGIGPDLCLMAAMTPRNYPLLCLGDRALLAARARALRLALALEDYSPGSPCTQAAGSLTVLNMPLPVPAVAGKLDVRNAPQVVALIDRAVDGCLAGEFSALVTAPVQKSTINEAGIPFTGHTEHIARLCGAPLPVMLLVAGALRVALATTHLPLRAVADAITQAGLLQVLAIVDHDLRRWWGIARPRIAVCGLNPHAGESGHLGDEELRIITPALVEARARGIDAPGPYPADTLFVPRHLEGIDAVLAMYHDQGLPVLKRAGFGDAVNVTLGLPIIRTSVDHGTALDLAGTGSAHGGSLAAALALAAAMVARRAGTAQ